MVPPIPAPAYRWGIRLGYVAAAYAAKAAARAWDERRDRLRNVGAQPGSSAGQPRVVILGGKQVGKTTLVNAWRGTWTDEPPEPTQARYVYGPIDVEVAGRRLLLSKLVDISGQKEAWSTWREQVAEGEIVLYLINAKALLAEERRRSGQGVTAAWTRIEDDAGQIRLSKSDALKLCLLVVTHRDLDPRFPRLGEDGYQGHIAGQLAPIVFKLGGDQKVRVVTGSLETLDAAMATTAKIVELLS